MRVCFLDFDGVLNRLTPKEYATIQPSLVSNLNHVLLATEAVIVVTSSWRHVYSLNEIGHRLQHAGCVKSVYDLTPVIKDRESCRGMEIGAWINANQDIENIVILDDWTDVDPFKKYLVQTNPWDGLTQQKAEEAIAILMSSNP